MDMDPYQQPSLAGQIQNSNVKKVQLTEALAIFETLDSRNQNRTMHHNTPLPTQPRQYLHMTEPINLVPKPYGISEIDKSRADQNQEFCYQKKESTTSSRNETSEKNASRTSRGAALEAERRLRNIEWSRTYHKRKEEAELLSQNVKHNVSNMLNAECTKRWNSFQNDSIPNQHVCQSEYEKTLKMEIDIEESSVIKTEEPVVTPMEDFPMVKIESDEPIEDPIHVHVPNKDSCIFEKKFGFWNGAEMLKTLKDEYANRKYTNMKILDGNNNFVVSIITPFMQRVAEKMKQSSEIWFVESMSSVDPMNCKVILLMINSCFGGLPVAVIVTSLETCEAITEGFKMMQELFSPTSFGGRGKRGPVLFMTRRDYKAERAALLNVFPEARLLFCQVKVLAQMRNVMKKCPYYPLSGDTRELPMHIRTLNNNLQPLIHEDDAKVVRQKVDEFMQSLLSDHTYSPLDRKNCGLTLLPAHKRILLNKFESLIYESDVDIAKQKIDDFLNHEFMITYPEFHIHLQNFLIDLESWAECHRADLITRGQSTNSIGVAAAKVVYVMMRNRIFQSPIALLKILTNDFPNEFILKLSKFSTIGPSQQYRLKFVRMHKKCEKLVYSSDEHTILESDTMKKYVIDLEKGLCSCLEGANGNICAHLFKVFDESNNESLLILPRTQRERNISFYIATGCYLNNESHTDLEERIPYPVLSKQRQGAQNILSDSITQDTNDSMCEGPVLVKVEPDAETIAHGYMLDEVKEEAIQDECVFDEIDDVLIDLKSKISENPALWNSVNELISSYKKIETITELESAMSSFARQDADIV